MSLLPFAMGGPMPLYNKIIDPLQDVSDGKPLLSAEQRWLAGMPLSKYEIFALRSRTQGWFFGTCFMRRFKWQR